MDKSNISQSTLSPADEAFKAYFDKPFERKIMNIE